MNKLPKNIFKLLSIFVLATLLVFFLANLSNVRDLYRAATFTPSAELAAVESSLGLTPYGRRIFRASTPTLTSDHSAFESVCYSDTDPREASILGCYIDDQIYLYSVDSAELPGLEESTSAHELLHAVYACLSSSEKSELTPLLESLLATSSDAFRDSLASYPEDQRLEETYVRSATQIRSLPDRLEAHFAKIFTDQDAIVAFYDSYIAPLTATKNTLKSLETELSTLRTALTSDLADFDSRSAALESAVADFNSCASTPGCFTSRSAFDSRRAELLAEQSALSALADFLNNRIATYNTKVDLYNSNVLRGETLNSLLNPNLKTTNLTE